MKLARLWQPRNPAFWLMVVLNLLSTLLAWVARSYTLAPLAMLFLFGALSFGMLLSIITKSQLLASQLAIVTTVLPAFLLSGFIFPIENMPLPIQAVTHIITARYFVFILRGIYLKDVGIGALWPEVLFLAAFGLIVMVVAVGKFKKKII